MTWIKKAWPHILLTIVSFSLGMQVQKGWMQEREALLLQQVITTRSAITECQTELIESYDTLANAYYSRSEHQDAMIALQAKYGTLQDEHIDTLKGYQACLLAD